MKNLSYRSDIDGLRGISIILVLIFHAFPEVIKSGFIGVDIFFVISGFLITSIILKQENFSFLEFYAGRIIRIFPALILVLTACLVFGWLFLLSSEFRQLGKHVFGGGSFISNFILLKESGYFDKSALTKPLLHLWSLGIEEQFYIFWPVVLLFRRGSRALLLLILLGSLSFNIYHINISQSETFYLPYSRIWELMIGALIAHLNIRNKDYSLFGFLLIIISAFSLREKTFPGCQALLPTLGAALLIISEKSYINQKILSNKLLVWIGLISYPLYLWHWPLFSFTNILIEEVSVGMKFILIFISILLAWLTYIFVERPMRFMNYKPRKILGLALAMALLGGMGYYIYKEAPVRDKEKKEFEDYFENSAPEWRYFQKNNIFEKAREDCNFYQIERYRIGKDTKIPKDYISPSCYTRDFSKKKVLFLWGDSHVQQLYFALKNNLPTEWQVLIVASSACEAKEITKDSSTDYCQRSNYLAFKKINEIRPDVVLIAQNVDHDYLKFKKLEAVLSVKKVLFLGPTPHWEKDLTKIIVRDLWHNTPERTMVKLNQKTFEENLILSNQFANSNEFINLLEFFCNKDGCLTRIGDNKMEGITSIDTGHLSLIASDYLVKNLLVNKIVN